LKDKADNSLSSSKYQSAYGYAWSHNIKEWAEMKKCSDTVENRADSNAGKSKEK
jgi:hypothetical protein